MGSGKKDKKFVLLFRIEYFIPIIHSNKFHVKVFKYLGTNYSGKVPLQIFYFSTLTAKIKFSPAKVVLTWVRV